MRVNHTDQKQNLVNWGLVLLVVVLVTGGLYLYLQYKSPDISGVINKYSAENGTTAPKKETSTQQPSDYDNQVDCKQAGYYWYDRNCHKEKLASGIILIKEKSGIKQFASNLAQKRGWSLVVANYSDPTKIANKVQQATDKYSNIEYLLIIGKDEQIPLKGRKSLISSSAETNNSEEIVLDSLLYGDVDEDNFVELSVGRLPFTSEKDLKSYFENLEVNGSQSYYAYYPIYDEVGPSSFAVGKCLDEEWNNVFIQKSPKKEKFINHLKKAKLFSVKTHGGPSSWSLKNSLFNRDDVPSLHSRRPVIISDTCLSAQDLGPEFLRKGAGAFLGANFETGSFAGISKNLVFSKEILSGVRLGKVIKKYQNFIIARNTVDNKFKYQKAQAPVVNLKVDGSALGDYTFILLGDPLLQMDKVKSNLNEISVNKKNDRLLVNIPRPDIETIELDTTYKIQCLGGQGEIKKVFEKKKDWNKMLNTESSPVSPIGHFVFSVPEVNSVTNGVEVIQKKKFDFKIIRLPFAGLVKGNRERYLVIEEDLLIDPSVLLNARKIILRLGT